MMFNSLSVRTGSAYVRVSREVEVRGPLADLQQPKLTILVHGFQNSETAASKSYASFRNGLAQTTRDPLSAAIGPIWDFHWPGDLENMILSIGSFPARIPDAINSAATLARFLGPIVGRNCEVTLIGHSLGCLLILETIRCLMDSNEEHDVARAILFAAAVPVAACDLTNGDYVLSGGRRELIAFSANDLALGELYALGALNYYGRHAEAVGRHGNPGARWTGSLDTGYSHGKYWSSTWMADEVASELGSPPKNRITTWNGPLYRLAPPLAEPLSD